MENNDLIWNLEKFKQQQVAKELILGIENQLCVFSGTVEQLYTSYDIFFPHDENRKLVILPNPYAPHDTFHGIGEDAVSPTGLFLVAGGEGDSKKLKLVIPINKKAKKYRSVPLEVGIKLINSKREADRPFLPLLMKGDLREFNQSTPCIHLHSLNLEKVKLLSELELKAIEEVILERLSLLTAAMT